MYVNISAHIKILQVHQFIHTNYTIITDQVHTLTYYLYCMYIHITHTSSNMYVIIYARILHFIYCNLASKPLQCKTPKTNKTMS